MPRAPSTRPPSAGSGSGARSRARNNPKTRSLNAFSIAQSTATATRRRRPSKHTPTTADPDPDATTTSRADSASVDGGSDSDGGHWRVGVGSGDDSESDIDSDEALGASDEERFAGFAFRGSSSSGNKNKNKEKKKGVVTLDESDDDDDDEEEEEDDGEGFVDLSEMLDRATPSGSESGDEAEEAEEAAGKLQKNRPKKRAAPESESEDDSAGGLELEEPSMSEADDDSGSGSGSDSDSNDSFAHFSEEEEEDDDGGDPAALAALQSRIAALPSGSKHASKRARLDTDPNEGKTPNEYNLAPTPHTKLTITDLLPTIADRTLKKSLKTLSSDDGATTAKSSGMQAGKLAAPLPKRQQDRIDRAAAYVQTTTALGRWAATVKTQREAEHLRFPLPNAPNAPVATPQRLLSLSATEARGGAGAQTELEATVSRILKESNMASERKLAEFEELQTNRMSVEEVQRRTAELRMARELLYREELRAKRVKKIKSKAYRRVHKKERARQEQAVEEALALERGGRGAEAEEEVMERERRRAEERMTLRHKQSRWAKGLRESGRSVWDDEAQEGAVEMARRAEELTRRIRGKGARGEFGESGSGSSSSEDEEDEDDDAFDEEGVELRRKLAKDIEKAEASLGVSSPGAGNRLGGRLMGMKFMQTAEAAKRKENDAQLEELKNMLMDADRPGGGSEGEDDEDEKEQEEQQHKQASGRMTFRPGKKEKEKKRPSAADRSEFEEQDLSGQEQQDEDGEEEQEDEEVTFVNRANAAAASSSTALKNPFTAPRTTAGAAGGKHTSFGAGNDTAPAAAGNPWLPQDAPPHPQRKQPTLSSSTKTESRTERSSKKLARSRHAALAPAEAEAEVEIDTSATLQLAPKKQQPTPTPTDADGDGDGGEDEVDEVDAKDIHLIPAHRGGGKAAQSQRALVRRAFAGDDVVAQFVEEKRAVVAAEGDRVVDERLPGWGSWAGEGLPQSQSQTQDDRFVKVVKGVVAPERRKDRRLARVVVNEKRVKKNIKYHASALPHVFETKQQYERSLRIPIGPEWATKTTFQDATMPRVVVKRGVVVEPISAPFK